jgi:zinc/manganese transport system permease protein
MGFLVDPFLEFIFLRRALVATAVLACAAGPLGVLLQLRRLTLVADSLQHAILPGVAVAFLLAGLSVAALAIGGLIAGLAVAFAALYVTRRGWLRPDASFGAAYMIALAAGVALISHAGSPVDLVHLLFGNPLAVDETSLLLVATVATLVLVALAVCYRPLVARSLDVQGMGPDTDGLFMALVVLTLIGGFQTLGAQLVLGFTILPAAAATLVTRRIWTRMAVAIGFGLAAAWFGLAASNSIDVAAGPAVVLVAGAIYLMLLVMVTVRQGARAAPSVA